MGLKGTCGCVYFNIPRGHINEHVQRAVIWTWTVGDLGGVIPLGAVVVRWHCQREEQRVEEEPTGWGEDTDLRSADCIQATDLCDLAYSIKTLETIVANMWKTRKVTVKIRSVGVLDTAGEPSTRCPQVRDSGQGQSSPACCRSQVSSFIILGTCLAPASILFCDPRFKVWEEEAEFHRKPRVSSQMSDVSELQGPGGRQG